MSLMKCSGALRAMMRGGMISFFALLILIVSAALFRPVEESLIGRMIGEFPVPVGLLDGATSFLFGSTTSEGGILIFLAMVCIEVALAGVMLGYSFYAVNHFLQKHGRCRKNV